MNVLMRVRIELFRRFILFFTNYVHMQDIANLSCTLYISLSC